METTTVRVRTSTRDAVRRLAERRSATADTVIAEALQALEWRELRERAGREAVALRADPRERQLAQEVARDLDALGAR